MKYDIPRYFSTKSRNTLHPAHSVGAGRPLRISQIITTWFKRETIPESLSANTVMGNYLRKSASIRGPEAATAPATTRLHRRPRPTLLNASRAFKLPASAKFSPGLRNILTKSTGRHTCYPCGELWLKGAESGEGYPRITQI